MAAAAAAGLTAGSVGAQDVFLDRDGVWRYVRPPVILGPADPVQDDYIPRPVIRQAPVDDALRALVPSYDEPAYEEPPYDEPAFGDLPPEGPEVRILRGRSIEPDRDGSGYGPSDDAWADPDPYGLPRIDDGASTDFGDPQQAEIPLPDPADVPGGGDLVSGLARYAAAKRTALADADAGARLNGVRTANAYLLTLAAGDISTAAIRGIDTMLGLGPVTEESVRLPGGGTEVKRPDARPTQADRDGARRVVDYGLLRNRGEAAADAVRRVMGEGADLSPSVVAAVDGFLGLETGGFAIR